MRLIPGVTVMEKKKKEGMRVETEWKVEVDCSESFMRDVRVIIE